MIAESQIADADAFLEDLPALHHWGGAPQVGGLNKAIGRRLIEVLGRYETPRVVETGAGASTLLFLVLGAELTSIAPDAKLYRRILDEADRRDIDAHTLRFVCEPSELALPRLAASGRRVDVALIDGHHGWPNVFVDFCYFNMMLGTGGTLLVDDLQLYSVGQLALQLADEPGYELRAVDDKMATFTKLTDAPGLADWRGQPFIERQTATGPNTADVLRARLAA
jgi:hypothetical protein